MNVSRLVLEGEPRALAAELRSRGAQASEEVVAGVAETIAAIRAGGDAALLELSRRFDGHRATELWVADRLLAEAVEKLDPELREALEIAIENVRAVAEAQIDERRPETLELAQGQRVTVEKAPVSAAAVYVPGGRAPYPSSVVMGVIPARVAGVGRIVVASPPGADGRPSDAVLAAASLCGADAVLAAGGAQAIAALAHGTETIPPVDVIAGPGSAWVQEAKLQCSRVVGIDGYAGPSELVVVADAEAEARWIALDLIAQAEHGPDGLLLVASPDGSFLDRLAAAVEEQAASRPTSADAELTLLDTTDLEQAIALADALAPEHLQIDCEDAERIAKLAPRAGCTFVGRLSATAFGDYAAGSNHVLPTGGAARFGAPLGPAAFQRRASRVRIDERAAAALAPVVSAIASAEGFVVHAESVEARSSGRSSAGEGE